MHCAMVAIAANVPLYGHYTFGVYARLWDGGGRLRAGMMESFAAGGEGDGRLRA